MHLLNQRGVGFPTETLKDRDYEPILHLLLRPLLLSNLDFAGSFSGVAELLQPLMHRLVAITDHFEKATPRVLRHFVVKPGGLDAHIPTLGRLHTSSPTGPPS